MKPLSTTRKALVSAAFLLGVGSTLYGFLVGNGWALRIGLYSFFGFVMLFALLILPYWGRDPKLGPSVN